MTTPIYAQRGCRFRVDDASVNWLADENNNYSIALETNFRIRIEIENTNNANGSPVMEIWASRNGGGYAQVTSSTTYIQASLSDHYADGADDSTNRLTTATSSFSVGTLDEDGTETVTVSKNDHNEIEYCLKITSASSPSDYFDFRVYDAGSPLGGGYSYTIRMTALAGAATVPMDAVSLVSSGQALDVSPGAVQVDLSYVTLASSPQNLTASSQPPAQSIVMGYATLVSQAQATDVEVGSVSIAMGYVTLVGASQSLAFILGGASIDLGSVTLVGSAQGLTVLLAGAPHIIDIDYVTLTTSPQSLDVISLGAPLTIQAGYTSLSATAQSLDVISVGAPLTIQMGFITLVSQAQSLVAGIGAMVINLNAIMLIASPQNLLLELTVTIFLNYVILSSTARAAIVAGIAIRPPEVILFGSWEEEEISGSWVDEELEASL